MRKKVLIWLYVCFVSTHAIAQGNPMFCKITGQIITILKPVGQLDNSICSKYPCKAIVRISNISDCGSSVTAMPYAGDTIEINFGFTLANTKKALPTMRQHYPGLKKGNRFKAQMEQRIQPGGKNQFTVYHYSLK
jgi:hypothetical protein